MFDLPGPERFANMAAADVNDGYSVVLVFPEHMVNSGDAEVVLRRVADLVVADELTTEPGLTVPDRIASSLGLAREWHPTQDPWHDLVRWPAAAGRTLCLPGWRSDVAEHLEGAIEPWETLQHEAGVRPRDRFRLLIGCGRAPVEAVRYDHLRPLHLRVHWWWGVVNRIDTELHLQRRSSSQRLDPLHHAVLAETVAWDLDLADRLPPSVDCSADSIADYLDGNPSATLGTLGRGTRSDESLTRPPAEGRVVPPRSVRPDWDAGHLELWDGRYRPRLTAESIAAELPRLTWRAQSRVLFPYLEEHRAELEELVLDHSPPSTRTADEERVRPPTELGPLWAKVRNDSVRIPADQKRRLRAAVKVRNKLAHLETAPEGDLRVLLQSLPL